MLLQGTPECNAGAIFEENCDAGDQQFICINFKDVRLKDDQTGVFLSRRVVMEQPYWFQEVIGVNLTMDEYDRFKKNILSERMKP